MTDHTPLDERGLELATSHQFPASNGIDPAVKSARKDWQAIGAAADNLGRTGLNEQALLASLQAQLIKATPAKIEEPKAQTFDWSWLAVGLAASVLLAATIVGALSQRTEQIVEQPGPGPKGPSQFVKPNRSVEPQGSSPEETTAPQLVQTSDWDDLDEAINTTYTALQALANERRGLDQSLTDFDSQLKQLSAEIAGESL